MYVWQRHIVVETLMIYASELETARECTIGCVNDVS